MARPIVLSRNLKLEWLNKTVELVLEEKSEIEVRSELNEYLACDIKCPSSIRKTREILMDLWVYRDTVDFQIRKRALELYDSHPSDALILHWCMLLLCYPIFSDLCGLIGKVSTMQDTFTVSWLKAAMAEDWGERTTLSNAVTKILQSMKNFGVIENVGRGVYVVKKQSVHEMKIVDLMVRTILALGMKPYYEVVDLAYCSQMFPFAFEVSHEMIHDNEGYELQSINGSIVIMLHSE